MAESEQEEDTFSHWDEVGGQMLDLTDIGYILLENIELNIDIQFEVGDKKVEGSCFMPTLSKSLQD